MSELDDGDAAFKDLPYYKAIFKSFLRKQIQHLLEELSSETGEESIILTANINNGTLSHLGSCTGKGFLEGREDIKKQFLSYCLKTYHGQKTHESQSPYQRTHQSPRIGSSPAAKRPRHQAASSSPVILHEHNKVPVHHTPSTATSPYSEVGSLYTTGTNSAEQSNEDTNNVKIEKTETEGKNHSSELSLPLFAKMSSTTSSSTSVDYQYKASDLGSHTQSSADVYGETTQGTDTHFEHKGETSEVDYGCREIKREPDDIDDMEITGVDAAGDSSMSFENWGQGQYGLGTSTTDLNEGSANNTMKRPAKSRIVLSLFEKIQILQDHESTGTMSQRKLAEKYNVSKTTIGEIIRKKEFYLKHCMTANLTRKRVAYASKYADVNEVVLQWFLEARGKREPISGPIVQEKALQFAREMSIPGFKASNGWLQSWRNRYGIDSFKMNPLLPDGASQYGGYSEFGDSSENMYNYMYPQKSSDDFAAGVYEDPVEGSEKSVITGESVEGSYMDTDNDESVFTGYIAETSASTKSETLGSNDVTDVENTDVDTKDSVADMQKTSIVEKDKNAILEANCNDDTISEGNTC